MKDVDPDEAVQDIRKGWMEFEFSYDSESKKEDASSTSTSTSVEASYNNILYSVSGMLIVYWEFIIPCLDQKCMVHSF